MLLSVNHSSGSIPKLPQQGRHCQYTRPMEKHGETETIHLGVEMNPEEIIAKSNIGMKISGDQKPARQVGPHLGEKMTVILMLKTTPEATWCRAEWTVPELIGRIRLDHQWPQGRFVSAKGFGLPLFHPTSG